jgi:hypothetical protein
MPASAVRSKDGNSLREPSRRTAQKITMMSRNLAPGFLKQFNAKRLVGHRCLLPVTILNSLGCQISAPIRRFV